MGRVDSLLFFSSPARFKLKPKGRKENVPVRGNRGRASLPCGFFSLRGVAVAGAGGRDSAGFLLALDL